MKEPFGSGSTTGIALRNGYLYLAHPTTIERIKMTAGQLKPTGAAETIVTGLPDRARSTRTRASRSTGTARSTSTSARRRTPARIPIVVRARRGQDPVPASREARRHLEVRREQARTDAGAGHAVRDRPASDAGHHLARRRALHRDEQPRSARRRSGRTPSRRRTTPSGRPSRSIARCRGRTSAGRTASSTTRMKKFLLNPEYGGDGKDGRPLREVHAAGGGVPGALGAGRHQVLHGHAVPGEVSRRRVHRVPRLVESLADAAGRLQRDVPADRERQGVGRFRGVRRWLHRKIGADATRTTRSRGPTVWRRRPTARSTSARVRRERSGA